MFNNVFTQVFGSRNQRLLKKLNALVTSVAALESKYAALDDAQLAQQTVVLRERLAKGETLDQLRADAFAVTREAGKCVMGMRHFDVQLRTEEHTSELQSLMRISYAVFCLHKKTEKHSAHSEEAQSAHSAPLQQRGTNG